MNIALLAQRQAVHTVRWANGLAQRGHDVHLLSSSAHGDALDPDVRFHHLPYAAPLGYFRNRRAVRRILNETRPDVLNTHFASGYGTLARRVGFHPHVLSVWGSDVFDYPDRSRLHRRWLTGNLRAADTVCSTSHVMASRVEALAPGLDLFVVPFGIDTDAFRPAREGARQGERERDVVIGTVKSLGPRYGIDVLLRAFALARERWRAIDDTQDAQLRLVIAGDGPDRSVLQAFSKDLGISRETTFLGRVPHERVPSVLADFDIFAALSREESFGVAVLEASSSALPVVVSDAGGLPEVVEPGQTGLVVPVDDVEASASALLELALDEGRRLSMGAAGRDHVLANYGWSASLEAMEQVLHHAVACYQGSSAETYRASRAGSPE